MNDTDLSNKPTENASGKSNFLVSCWKGLEPLWKAYWIGYVVFSFFVLIVITIVAAQDYPIILLIGLLFVFVYYAWAIVSVWRCAFNTGQKFWGYLARFIVVVYPLSALFEAFS